MFEKKVAARSILESVLNGIVTSPSTQIDPQLQREAIEATKNLAERTDAELFDIIQRVGDRGSGEVSSFVHVLCNLKRFYVRPQEMTVVDRRS
jgi:hypothetical protein